MNPWLYLFSWVRIYPYVVAGETRSLVQTLHLSICVKPLSSSRGIQIRVTHSANPAGKRARKISAKRYRHFRVLRLCVVRYVAGGSDRGPDTLVSRANQSTLRFKGSKSS